VLPDWAIYRHLGYLASSSATKNSYLAIDSLLGYSMVPNCSSSAQNIIYPCCSNIQQGQMILYVFDVERIFWLLILVFCLFIMMKMK